MTATEQEFDRFIHLARKCAAKDTQIGRRNDFRRARTVLEFALGQFPRNETGANPIGVKRTLVLEYAAAWLEDPDIHRWRATGRAWDAMADHFPQLDADLDAEVLQLLGKIHRRRWDISGQSRDLRRAVYYYQLGFTAEQSPDPYTRGLNGFHAALLMVDLARLEERAVFYLGRDTDYSSRVPPIEDFWDDDRTSPYIDRLVGLTAPQLRCAARRLFEGAYEILAAEAESKTGGRWEVNAATAAALFGLRRYAGAAHYAGRANNWPAPGDHVLQGWAQEFVSMARQRGIRPDAAAVMEALDRQDDLLQLAPPTATATATAALDRFLELEEAAWAGPPDADRPPPIEVVTDEFGFGSVHEARSTVITAEQAKVFEVVNELLHEIDRDMVLNSFTGKVGLALSGGGFRASLYHVGVLAALAELGLLRHVQVLSCVSGGSITGTYYYLLAKELLSTKPDGLNNQPDEIHNRDYIEIVEQLSTGLVEAAGLDLRARLPMRFGSNVRLLFNYSPSKRLGDLIDKLVLPKVRTSPDSPPRAITHLSDLAISPLTRGTGEGTYFNDGEFKPRRKNWTRAAKVPVLVMNATALNTGHNWQLTARHMGEPPAAVDPTIDSNPRLRRVYFDEALVPPVLPSFVGAIRQPGSAVAAAAGWMGVPTSRTRPRQLAEWGDEGLDEETLADLKALLGEIESKDPRPPLHTGPLRVGHAVAASAAVPGVFDPLSLDAGDATLTIKLLDGGVVDNQGITGLVEQDCDVLLISDASGQLSPQPRPRGGVFPALRSNLISLQRIRAAQYDDLTKQRRSQQIRDFLFVHLTKGIKPPSLDDEERRWDDELTAEQDPIGNTEYDVDRRVQSALALIRTDLDSFSELEAHSLMTSGYLATRHELRNGIGPFGFKDAVGKLSMPSHDWDFLAVRELIGPAAEPGSDLAKRQERVREHLERSSRRFMRWIPRRAAVTVQAVIALAVAVLVAWLVARPERLLPAGTLLAAGLLVIAASFLVRLIGIWRDSAISSSGAVGKVLLFVLTVPLMVLSWPYVGFRRVFPRLRRGRVAGYL